MTENSELVPDGWTRLDWRSGFSHSIGPVYLRTEPAGLGFVASEEHTNLNGVVHGGAMATLADIGLFTIATNGVEKMNGATLSLNLNYLRPAKPDRFIHCEGRIVRKGSSIIFVQGGIFDGADELLTFDGVIKRFQ